MIIDSLKNLAVPIDSLKGLPNNPRRGDVNAVMASLSRFGQRKPIVVRRDDGTILAGNHTWLAAQELGWKEIAVAYVGDDDVTAQAYALADNRTAELGSYDDELLKELIDSVGEVDPDLLKDTGWSDDAVGDLLAKIEAENPKVVDEDDVPEPPVEPKTKLGDVYQLGRHRLMCGDSTDEANVKKLMNGNLAKMFFTDPPYGVDYQGVTNDYLKAKNLRQFLTQAFKLAFLNLENGSNAYVWHADIHAYEFIGAFRDAGFTQAKPSIIQWVKDSLVLSQGDYHLRNEPCLYGWKKGSNRVRVLDRTQDTIWEFPKPKKAEGHPTMKPIKLCSRAIQNSSVQQSIILDLFGGSGSTLIAAEQTDRICYMMELEPQYCDVIIERWETLTGEKAVLVSNAESTEA